jgi:methylated-DNA-[protein]-cysteine S-methyltransferase
VPELLQRIHRFHRGERVAFDDVPLDLDWCTPFQRDVAEALRRVPWGEVVSYGELAAAAGHPRAQRAAGTFCAENRFALFLPCHRVVAADGIGSYGSSGVSRKRRLLRLEGHVSL